MNQILQTENKKNNGPVEIKKIIIFFVVAIIIFGVILISLGAYHLFTQNNEETPDTTQEEQAPEVSINREEDDIVIEVSHSKPILKIVYKWNEEEEKTIQGNNQTSISEKISLPYGTNTLYLTVIDINGKEKKFQKEYVVEGDGKPVIELKLTADNKKIKIIAQDESNLSNIMYSWNNGEQTKVDATQDNLKLIEQEVEIPLGQNTLKVEAVNVNNMTTTKEIEVKGIKGPVLSFQKDGAELIIKAEDEVGMKIIDLVVNGQKYQINYGNKKVIEYRQKLIKGENNLEIKAENQDGGITIKKVKVINNK